MQFQAKPGRTIVSREPSPLLPPRVRTRRGEAAFVLSMTEVLISFLIVALMFGVIINGYTVAARRAEWTGYSLASQSLALQTIEQARAAVWDPSEPDRPVEITNLTLIAKTFRPSAANWTNFSGYTTNIIDVPWKGTNYVLATNWVTVSKVRLAYNTNIMLQMVRVDSVWPFNSWGKMQRKYFTNTICTFLAPDNAGMDYD